MKLKRYYTAQAANLGSFFVIASDVASNRYDCYEITEQQTNSRMYVMQTALLKLKKLSRPSFANGKEYIRVPKRLFSIQQTLF